MSEAVLCDNVLETSLPIHSEYLMYRPPSPSSIMVHKYVSTLNDAMNYICDHITGVILVLYNNEISVNWQVTITSVMFLHHI